MTTGKTNAVFMRAYFDEVDLSGDARGFGQVGIEFDEHDTTGWSDGVQNFNMGHPRTMLEGFQAIFNNTALLGSYTELSVREEYLISLHFGIKAAPATGDPAWMAPMEQRSYMVDGSGPMLTAAELSGPGQGFTLPGKVWGKVLYPLTSISATTDGTSFDDGAATTNGAQALLHITSAETVGTWVCKVQDSPNDTAWADVITFSADGTSITAEQGVEAGTTIDQWLRFQATYTGGGSTGASFVCTVVRQ